MQTKREVLFPCKSINVGDEVFLRAEKSGKLSSNFRLSLFKVVWKTGSQATVKNDTGIEFKRNATYVKKYTMPSKILAIMQVFPFSKGRQGLQSMQKSDKISWVVVQRATIVTEIEVCVNFFTSFIRELTESRTVIYPGLRYIYNENSLFHYNLELDIDFCSGLLIVL